MPRPAHQTATVLDHCKHSVYFSTAINVCGQDLHGALHAIPAEFAHMASGQRPGSGQPVVDFMGTNDTLRSPSPPPASLPTPAPRGTRRHAILRFGRRYQKPNPCKRKSTRSETWCFNICSCPRTDQARPPKSATPTCRPTVPGGTVTRMYPAMSHRHVEVYIGDGRRDVAELEVLQVAVRDALPTPASRWARLRRRDDHKTAWSIGHPSILPLGHSGLVSEGHRHHLDSPVAPYLISEGLVRPISHGRLTTREEIRELEEPLVALAPFKPEVCDQVPSRDDLNDASPEELADAYATALDVKVRASDGQRYTPAPLAQASCDQAVAY